MRIIALTIAFACLVFSCRDRATERKSAAFTLTSTPPSAPIKRSTTRPSLPPQLPTTTLAWAFAESSDAAEAWDATADAYEQELASCTEHCSEVAYAIVLARKNALRVEDIQPPPGDAPVPLPPRAQAALDALDQFVALNPDDPDAGGMKFLAANLLRRWHQPDALTRLEAVLRENRMDPTAEYAANLLLDALVRADRVAEVKALVDNLLADAAFMAGKDELRQTLERLRTVIAQAGP